MSDSVSLLCELIRVDTHNPGGDELALARILADKLRAFSPSQLDVVEVPRDDAPTGGYVFAVFGTPKLLFNVHIDTVPANKGWTSSPFDPVVTDDRVVGLGSADTKGAAAALLCAMENVAPKNIAILFSGDEECIGTCMQEFVTTSRTHGIERAIVCEPTGCRPGIRHRGIIAMEARFSGRGGHSSAADTMPAPIAELARLAVALDDWGKAQRDHGPEGFRGMCMNVAMLEGGVAVNVVPDEATLSWSVRPPPDANADAVHAELRALVDKTVPSATINTLINNPPFLTKQLEDFRPLLGSLVDTPIDMPFWTEAAALSAVGIDAVVFGPGDIAQAHAPDEFVTTADLRTAQTMFEKALHAAR